MERNEKEDRTGRDGDGGRYLRAVKLVIGVDELGAVQFRGSLRCHRGRVSCESTRGQGWSRELTARDVCSSGSFKDLVVLGRLFTYSGRLESYCAIAQARHKRPLPIRLRRVGHGEP